MDEAYLEQAKMVVKILPILSSYPQFALKGGTAINYFIQPFPRLSVDIDLTYLPITNRDRTLIGISETLEQILFDIVNHYPDYKILPKNVNDSISALVISRQKSVIKIEPNPVFRGTVFRTTKLNLVPEAEHELELFASANCLSTADLYGSKICAALDRQHPRDLFDIKLLLDTYGLTKEIRQAFIVYLASHSRPIAELLAPNLQNLKSIFENEFLGMTRDPISLEELQHIRETLIRELHEKLTQDERQFILSIKEGQPNWQLLPIPGIDKLPSIQWKLLNIRRIPENKHKQAVQKLKTILQL